MQANDRYRMLNALGEGTYAEVFRAEHREHLNIVAFKRAKNSADAFARIKREIDAQKELAHPDMMPILDYDQTYRWLAMPVAKGSLADIRSCLTKNLVSILLDPPPVSKWPTSKGLYTAIFHRGTSSACRAVREVIFAGLSVIGE